MNGNRASSSRPAVFNGEIMNAKLAEQFADIAKETIEQVDRTECSLDDYFEGLQLIVGEINVAISDGEEGRDLVAAIASIFSNDGKSIVPRDPPSCSTEKPETD